MNRPLPSVRSWTLFVAPTVCEAAKPSDETVTPEIGLPAGSTTTPAAEGIGLRVISSSLETLFSPSAGLWGTRLGSMPSALTRTAYALSCRTLNGVRNTPA